MGRAFKIPIVPHSTQADASASNMLHFASATPEIGPPMEFPWRGPVAKASWYSPHFEVKDGRVQVPTGPGFGVEFDPDFIAKAFRVEK